MELKRGHQRTPADTSGLLIVPYGIETFQFSVKYFTQLLLIVPYGIETYMIT